MIHLLRFPTRSITTLGVVAVLATLGGCATLSQDSGFSAIQEQTKARLNKDVRWARTDAERDSAREQIKPLLARPLSADDAVQIALLNNPGLQATYGELGIAEASLVQAGRLRNPGFSFQRLAKDGDHGEIVEIERKFIFDLLGLLTIPTRTDIETRRFEQAKLQVTGEVMRVAADTRRAWYAAVAAEQGVRYMEDVKEVADAGAELARRMAAAGNWSRLSQSRQQVFYAETVAQLARAKQAAVSEREKLTRLMGLWGEDVRFSLPARLPDLPQTAQEQPGIEAAAIDKRFDIRMAREEVKGLAKSLGLTKTTGFLNVLELTYLRNSETGEPRQTGYEIEISIPVFDFGDAKVARAEATYMQAVNRLSEIAVNARSEVREAYQAYRTAFDLAKHYRDEIVPLRKQISEENLLRYNGMLISVFELMADARQQMASVNGYIEALRDFWLAETDLETAMSTGGARGVSMKAGAMAAGGDAGGGH
jgi:outer membrane protein TolC